MHTQETPARKCALELSNSIHTHLQQPSREHADGEQLVSPSPPCSISDPSINALGAALSSPESDTISQLMALFNTTTSYSENILETASPAISPLPTSSPTSLFFINSNINPAGFAMDSSAQKPDFSSPSSNDNNSSPVQDCPQSDVNAAICCAPTPSSLTLTRNNSGVSDSSTASHLVDGMVFSFPPTHHPHNPASPIDGLFASSSSDPNNSSSISYLTPPSHAPLTPSANSSRHSSTLDLSALSIGQFAPHAQYGIYQPHATPQYPTGCARHSTAHNSRLSPYTNHRKISHVIPAVNADGTQKRCSNCCSFVTPSWRRHPETHALLCNACGLYHRLHNKSRPVTLDDDGTVKVIRKNAAVQKEPTDMNRVFLEHQLMAGQSSAVGIESVVGPPQQQQVVQYPQNGMQIGFASHEGGSVGDGMGVLEYPPAYCAGHHDDDQDRYAEIKDILERLNRNDSDKMPHR